LVARPLLRSAALFLAASLFVLRVRAAPEDAPPRGASPAAEAPLLAATTPDASRKAEAEERRQRALQFYDAGDYQAALGEFERANQLMPSFRLLYNLGVVSMALGDSASAYDYFQSYLTQGGGAVPADARAGVVSQLRDLAAQIATLTVLVDTAGAEVLVDERSIGVAPLVGPVHLNAGSHLVRARLRGAPSASRRLELAGGENARVALKLTIADRKPVASRKTTPWVGWGSTAVLAAGAGFAGLEALSAQHTYHQRFESFTTRAELDQSRSRATAWSIAADTLGGAAVVVGVYSLYLTLKHVPAEKLSSLAPGKVAVRLSATRACFSVSF